jgi:type III pantothenate kinase
LPAAQATAPELIDKPGKNRFSGCEIKMLLALDIGNTNTVAGIFDGTSLLHQNRIVTNRDSTAEQLVDSYANWLTQSKVEKEKIRSAIICSVVPLVTAAFTQMVQSLFKIDALILSSELPLPIKIDIDAPRQVGADRIANAVAAFSKYGGECIVVDFGTATNFDIVNKSGDYIGGVLLPGPETSMAELARKAAQLHLVDIEPPQKVIGRTTSEALMSGLFFGTVGQIDYMVERIIDEANFNKPAVIATGGLAEKFVSYSKYIQRSEPDLTLEGLRIISEYNKR